MITSSTVVVGSQPRINAIKFGEVLLAAASPALVEAGEMYQACLDNGIDPTFFLAIFKEESNFATDPASMVALHGTKNPGNCRTSSIGPFPVIPTERGLFVSYPNWKTGAIDATHRLTDSRFPYARAGAKTIGEIIPLWAPANDSNNPDTYIANVVKFMNSWITPGGNSSTMEIIDLSNNTPASVYTDRGLPISELVLHDTAGSGDFNNRSPAELQALLDATIRWFQGSGGVSIHYLIGPEALGGKIYRLCKEQFAAYHVIGNKGPYTFNNVTCSKDNRIAIGIERFGQPNEAVGPNQRAAMLALVVDICQRNNLSANQVISHMSIQSDRRDGGVLLDAARQAVNNGGLNYVTTQNTKPVIPATNLINGLLVAGGFGAFYDKLAAVSPNFQLLVLGLPVTNEFDCAVNGDGKLFTVQIFERGALLYEAASASPWDVHLMTTGQLTNALAAAKSKGFLN